MSSIGNINRGTGDKDGVNFIGLYNNNNNNSDILIIMMGVWDGTITSPSRIFFGDGWCVSHGALGDTDQKGLFDRNFGIFYDLYRRQMGRFMVYSSSEVIIIEVLLLLLLLLLF